MEIDVMAVIERDAMYRALVDQFGSTKLATIAYQRQLKADVAE